MSKLTEQDIVAGLEILDSDLGVVVVVRQVTAFGVIIENVIDDDVYHQIVPMGELLEDYRPIYPSSTAFPTGDIGEPTYIITEDTITFSYLGDTNTLSSDDSRFQEVFEAIVEGEWDNAHHILNISQAIMSWGNGLINIVGGMIFYDDMLVTNKLVDRIVEMMQGGDSSFEKYAKCLSLVLEQTSFKTRERIMDFVACSKIDINDDGHIIAFKNVDDNYTDWRTHTFSNKVGETPTMDRADVDDDHNHTCSNGLHVCSPNYLRDMWGTNGRTMKVTVDPRDVVAIPFDYNDTKARVCKYTVVEDVTAKISEYLT